MVFKKNYIPWNKGLTKEKDSRVIHGGSFGTRPTWNKGMDFHVLKMKE